MPTNCSPSGIGAWRNDQTATGRATSTYGPALRRPARQSATSGSGARGLALSVDEAWTATGRGMIDDSNAEFWGDWSGHGFFLGVWSTVPGDDADRRVGYWYATTTDDLVATGHLIETPPVPLTHSSGRRPVRDREVAHQP